MNDPLRDALHAPAPHRAVLPTRLERRRAFKLLGGVALMALAGCASHRTTASSTTTSTTSGSSSTSTSRTTTDASCSAAIPEETAGPYPADGSNGPDVLMQDGVVRGDIRSSFGSASGVADGVPLTIRLTVLDRATCSPLEGSAVYLWHCNIDGLYSIYSPAISDENYLRGVQQADRDGAVTFTSIFPAADSGRWPHIHFEVYSSLGEATSAGRRLATSQIALPEDTCTLVYATDGYRQSVTTLSRSSLATDNVFGDDRAVHQLATITGTLDDGLVAALSAPA